MFDQFENLLTNFRLFVLGRPILFVVLMGLLISILSVAGETAIYWIARLGGSRLITRLTSKGWLRMDLSRVERTETLFSRWGVRLVIFGRIFPGLRALVSIPAGLTHMNFPLFVGAAFIGAYVWNTLLVGIGYSLGFKITLLGVSVLG